MTKHLHRWTERLAGLAAAARWGAADLAAAAGCWATVQSRPTNYTVYFHGEVIETGTIQHGI